jgi:hypothetical protein
MPVLANAKHEAVAQAYVADPERIGWRAYRKVYPNSSRHAAETAWTRLLKIAEFSARLAELAEAAAQDAADRPAAEQGHQGQSSAERRSGRCGQERWGLGRAGFTILSRSCHSRVYRTICH